MADTKLPDVVEEGRDEREAEVQALIARALDPDDPYDGHHGNDRTVGE